MWAYVIYALIFFVSEISLFHCAQLFISWYKNNECLSGLEIATDTVANATNIFSLATKNSGLVAEVATRFLYALDLN